jgi:hypothetical protein
MIYLVPDCQVDGYDCGYATGEGVQEMSGKQLLRSGRSTPAGGARFSIFHSGAEQWTQKN